VRTKGIWLRRPPYPAGRAFCPPISQRRPIFSPVMRKLRYHHCLGNGQKRDRKNPQNYFERLGAACHCNDRQGQPRTVPAGGRPPQPGFRCRDHLTVGAPVPKQHCPMRRLDRCWRPSSCQPNCSDCDSAPPLRTLRCIPPLSLARIEMSHLRVFRDFCVYRNIRAPPPLYSFFPSLVFSTLLVALCPVPIVRSYIQVIPIFR